MKKTFALILTICLLLGTAGALAAGDPIRWLTTGDAGAKPIIPGDRILTFLNEKFGIELNVQYVPEGNVEKVNVAMASGDFPDIVTGSYGTSATQSWIDNEMLIPLNDYMDKYPHLKERLELYDWSAVDGKYYGIPFITQYNSSNALILMRKDWLNKLGLAYPKTLDELTKVLTAFTQDDPDGNGRNDTYGYTTIKPAGNFNWVFYAYGRQYGDYELNADGQVIPWFESDSFIPGMQYLRDLWEKGVIDPEFLLNDIAKMEEKFYQGKVGAVVVPLYRHVSRHENNLRSISPDASIVYGPAPLGPDGVSSGLNPQGKAGFLTAVTAVCKAPEKAVAFLDFMLSPEGHQLVRMGIEGIHYTVVDGKEVPNEEERAKDNFSPNGWAHPLAWGSLYWPLESGYLPEGEPNRDRALESIELATQAQRPNLIKQRTPLEVEHGSALDDIVTQYFMDMLRGSIPVEDGAKQLSQEWRSQGGDALLKELNEVYARQMK